MTTARTAATSEEAAYVFLERAKQELIQNQELGSLAVLVYGADQEQTYELLALVFTEETKRTVFQEVVSMAKEKVAKAIITVVPATYGGVDDGSPWRDCIFVTVSGPGIETLTLHLPYTKSRWLRRISFGELERKTRETGLGFLPGWAGDQG